MKELNFAAVALLAVAVTGSARGDTCHWSGGNDGIKSIEFIDTGGGTWEEHHNDQLISRYSVEQVKRHYYTQLYDESRDVRVRLWGDRVEVFNPESKRYKRLARGGWKDRFAKAGPVPLRYHGRYTGAGNRGGVPVDVLDRAAQRHDIGYERHGEMHFKTDARFVVDSGAAAFNPFNDMSALGRAKALGAGAVFVPKTVVDMPVAIGKKGYKVLKKIF